MKYTTEWLFLTSRQVHDALSRGLISVVTHIGTAVVWAWEAVSFQKFFVRFARECWEMAAGNDRVGEQLVGSSVVAQTTPVFFSRCYLLFKDVNSV